MTTADDDNEYDRNRRRKAEITDAEMYEILSNVTHTLIDTDLSDEKKDEHEIEFMLKDGRTMRTMMTATEIMDMMRFILEHKDLAKTIKLGPIGLGNKDLK